MPPATTSRSRPAAVARSQPVPYGPRTPTVRPRADGAQSARDRSHPADGVGQDAVPEAGDGHRDLTDPEGVQHGELPRAEGRQRSIADRSQFDRAGVGGLGPVADHSVGEGDRGHWSDPLPYGP